MTEAEWLSSNDPAAMLQWLTTHDRAGSYLLPPGEYDPRRDLVSDRKLRLFEDACFSSFGLNLDDVAVPMNQPAGAAALLRDIFGNPFRPFVPPHSVTRQGIRRTLLPSHPWLTWHDGTVSRLAQAAYDERGNVCRHCRGRGGFLPYEPGLFNETCHACHGTGRQGDGTLDPARLAVLADALVEADCDDEDILTHCRGPGPHVRGCWVVDLLLGKD